MSRVLYFDCPAGAAGDMILGAFLDAGLPLDALRGALGSLGIEHELRVDRVLRAGISATHVRVLAHPERSVEHHERSVEHHKRGAEHHKPHPEHSERSPQDHKHHSEHRSLTDIEALIRASALSPAGMDRAVALFRRIGEVEAAIHGVSVEEVHLHEVGALDSIIDIVGAVFALEWFGIDDVVASPLNVGSGTVRMAHGVFPVPAPATLRLLTGVPVYSTGVPAELVTPTGALLISAYAKTYGPLPAMTIGSAGYGAGTRQLDPLPNVLRVVIGERIDATGASGGHGSVIEMVTAIDDMSPEWFGVLSDRLFDAGALDVYLSPIQMKKGRPGTEVTVVAPADRRETLSGLLFTESTTIGVRWQVMARETLARRYETVALAGGDVRIKVALRDGQVVNAAPEYDDCARLAASTGRPLKQIHAEALAAWLGRGQG